LSGACQTLVQNQNVITVQHEVHTFDNFAPPVNFPLKFFLVIYTERRIEYDYDTQNDCKILSKTEWSRVTTFTCNQQMADIGSVTITTYVGTNGATTYSLVW